MTLGDMDTLRTLLTFYGAGRALSFLLVFSGISSTLGEVFLSVLNFLNFC